MEKLAVLHPSPNGQSMGFRYRHHSRVPPGHVWGRPGNILLQAPQPEAFLQVSWLGPKKFPDRKWFHYLNHWDVSAKIHILSGNVAGKSRGQNRQISEQFGAPSFPACGTCDDTYSKARVYKPTDQ